jgi:hypothetical protein
MFSLSLSAPVILWIAMVVGLVVLFGYRKLVDNSVDDLVHVSDASNVAISQQQTTARKLDQLDRVAKILASVMVIYGLGLCGMYVYQALQSAG